jgi:hypothetical protein
MLIISWLGNLKGRDYSKKLVVDGRVILEYILGKVGGKVIAVSFHSPSYVYSTQVAPSPDIFGKKFCINFLILPMRSVGLRHLTSLH